MPTTHRTPRTTPATPHPRAVGTLLALAGLANSAAAFHTGSATDLPATDDTRARLTQPESSATNAPLPPEAFDNLRLPLTPVEGRLGFSAARAWAWSGNADSSSTNLTTHRLLLDGDVRLVLGAYEFRARRAVVWLQRLPGSTEARPIYQVYASLQEVSTPGAAATVGVVADWLPVEGVITATQPVALGVDSRQLGRPEARELLPTLARAESDFSIRLAELAGTAPPPALALPIDLPNPPAIATDEDGRAGPRDPRATAEDYPIFPSRGTFYFSVGDKIQTRAADPDAPIPISPDANTVTLTGGVVAQYTDARKGRSLELTSDKAVVFLKPGPLADTFSGNFDADDVLGLYLEGAVHATDGSYTVRTPRLYYDVQSSKAIILDAVLWATEPDSGMPLYVRADALRQEAADQFSADNASISNTAFFKPHFAIGARDLTVRINPRTRRNDPDGPIAGGRTMLDARGIKFTAQGIPFLGLPRFQGDPENIPLRDVRFSDSSRRGAGLRTTWNAFALLGMEPPTGLDADARIDYFAESGLALGFGTSWNRDNSVGDAFVYALPDDRGIDVSPNGDEFNAGDTFRGIVRFQNMIQPSDPWRIRMEGTHASDTRFIESYFPDLADSAREITNRLQAQRTEGQTVLSAEITAASLDFLPNQNLLQAPGYAVDKIPELSLGQVTADVLDRSKPGLLTHTWDASYAQMRFRFSEETARGYGFADPTDAFDAFGTTPDQSLGDVFRAAGFNEELVNRFDTRHELVLPVAVGPINVSPFVVGRFTAYDSEFEDFSPNETDQSRFWGAAGVRVATEIHTINNQLDSRFFDLHRSRHIVEPSLTLWAGESSLDREDLPVYDDDVENLATGTILRVGLDQTWQTKRGGAGRWRSVDVLTLDTEYVWSSSEADRDDPFPRYYDPRPELSRPGEYAKAAATWQTTEIVSLAGETVYDFDARRHARSSAGVLIQHTDYFATGLDFRVLETQDSTYGGWTAEYRLTDKYRAALNATYDFDESDFRSVSTRLFRTFPVGTLGLTLNYDNIRGETSFGFILRPFGLRQTSALDLGAGGDRFGG